MQWGQEGWFIPYPAARAEALPIRGTGVPVHVRWVGGAPDYKDLGAFLGNTPPKTEEGSEKVTQISILRGEWE